MAELKPIEVDKYGLAKVSDGRYVNPNYATPESMAGILKNQNPQFSPQVIDSSVLASNETPVTIPQVNQSSIAPSLSAVSSSVVPQTKAITALEQETTKKAEEEKSFLNRQKEKIQGLMQSVIGVKGSQATLESEAKIGEKTQKVTDLTNQIESLDRAEQNELKAIQQVGTLTDVQKNAQIRAIQRQYAFEKADLALLQSAANRDLLTAQSIVDRKIQLQLEPLQMQLEFEKMFYDENREMFTKAEDRAFQAKLSSDERTYNEQKDFQENKAKILLSAVSQGAPSQVISAINQASDLNGVISAAGVYGGDILERQIKQAQLDKLYADIAEKDENNKVVVDTSGKVVVKPEEARKISKEVVSSDAYKALRKGQDSLQFLTDFENTLERTGSTSAVFDPIKNAELKAKYNATILNLKEFFNLGVLNGPDETILRGVIPDPTNTSNLRKVVQLGTYQPGTATKAGIANMKKQIETSLDERYSTLSTQYGDYSSESVGALKELQRTYISQKAALNPNVAKLIAENPNMSYEDIISIITNQ